MDFSYLMILLTLYFFGFKCGIVDDMNLSEEQLQELTRDTSNHMGRFNFQWNNRTIPYIFDDVNQFNDTYKNKIINAINFLKTHLVGCILIRYPIP